MRQFFTASTVGCCVLAASGCTVAINDPPAEIQRQAKEQLSQQTYQVSADVPGTTRIERPRPLVVATSPRVPRREDQPMKETAADALARIGTPAVPQVTVMLSNPNPELRMRAAQILAQIGPDAQVAVPELIKRLRDEDPSVRRAAAHALGQMGPAAGDAVPALLRAAQDEPLVP